MQMMKTKKGQGVFDALSAIAIGVAALAIVLTVAFLILSNLASNTQVAADANATAAVQTITNDAATIPSWVGLVLLVAIAGLILILVRGFRTR